MPHDAYLLIWIVFGILIEQFPCEKFVIKVNISENKGMGKDVIDLKNYIIRESLPINPDGLFKIIPTENSLDNYFELQPKTGLLKQRYNIDREAICESAAVCQKILLISINKQELEVRIDIDDENDHIPRFAEDHKTFSIPENSVIGCQLYLPVAYDWDSEVNSISRYYFQDVKRNKYEASKYFNISVETLNQNKTPYLKLKKEIDREENGKFVLILIAEDGGEKQGSCTITISLIDVNDNSPQWPTVNISKKIDECHKPGPLLKLEAFDRDDNSTLNGQIHYKISDRSTKFKLIDRLFFIDGSRLFLSGESLKLMGNESSISIIITAVDGGDLESDTTITIEIEDCNDHPPLITIDKPTVSVKENDRSSIVLTSLTVRDDDKGINSQFNCHLNDTTFLIMSKKEVHNQLNGIQIFCIKKISDTFFDRETLSSYSVLIRCIDLGSPPLIGEKLFSVIIIDENDNSPKFPADEIKFSIPENNNISTTIGYVTAVDPDSNENGRVTYQILNDVRSFLFTITSLGKIETNWKFDRELDRETFFLTIMAQDNGEPFLTDTCTVIITILDVNDCVPIFKQQYFHYQITEGNGLTTIYKYLDKVVAEDSDLGENGTVYYTISQMPVTHEHNNKGLNLLRITRDGALSIYGVVDREQTETIEAEIVAFDNGRPQLSSVVNVMIDVLDVNDNKPKFKYPLGDMNFFNLSTDTKVGKRLTYIEAEDPDKGENGTINYTIMSHKNVEQNLPFQLKNNGFLVLIKKLRRDNIPRFPDRLIIRASDNGTPPKSELLTIYIRYDRNMKNYSTDNMTLLNVLIGVLFVFVIMGVIFLVYSFFSERFSRNRRLENNNVQLPISKCLSMPSNSNYNQYSYRGETIPAEASILQSNSDHYNYINFTQNRAKLNEESIIEEVPENKYNSIKNVIPSNDRYNSVIRSPKNRFSYNTYSYSANNKQMRRKEKDFTLPNKDNIAHNKTKFNQQTLPSILHKKSPENEQMLTYQPKYSLRNINSSSNV